MTFSERPYCHPFREIVFERNQYLIFRVNRLALS
jgi:hypothetical protein